MEVEFEFETLNNFFVAVLKEAFSIHSLEQSFIYLEKQLSSKFPPELKGLQDLGESPIPEKKPKSDRSHSSSNSASTSSDGPSTSSLLGEYRNTLEYSIRSFFEDIISSSDGKSPPSLQSIERLFDMAIWMATKNYLECTTCFMLCEDLLESHTIETSEKLFTIMEKKAEKLATLVSYESRARTSILKLLVDLLRRVSKTNNTVFCGRILMFLSAIFPLSDKSGLNLKSDINQDNVTRFELTPYSDEMDVDDIFNTSTSGEPIDFNFYRTLWGLQTYFQSPQLVLQTNDKSWNELSKNLDSVLTAFATYSTLDKNLDTLPKEKSIQSSLESMNEYFFTKYLTSSKLIKLQLRDRQFREHILLQMLVLFQAIQAPIAPKSEPLKEKQKQVINEFNKRAREILELNATINNSSGKAFINALNVIFERESNWVNWKKEGCKPFEKYPKSTSQTTSHHDKKRKVRDHPIELQIQETKKIRMGSAELSRLWNLKVTEESLSERVNTPPLLEFLKPVEFEMDPSQRIEDQDKTKNNKVYTWKALRLIAKTRFQDFTKVATGSLEDLIMTTDKKSKTNLNLQGSSSGTVGSVSGVSGGKGKGNGNGDTVFGNGDSITESSSSSIGESLNMEESVSVEPDNFSESFSNT